MADQNSVQNNGGSSGLDPNVASLLCYICLLGIVFLVIEKNDKRVRFHAWQSLFLAVAMIVAYVPVLIISMIPILGTLFLVVYLLSTFALTIICMIKAYQGEIDRKSVV